MRSIRTVEHSLQVSTRGNVWHYETGAIQVTARTMASQGRVGEALEEAHRMDAHMHRQSCPEADHSHCKGFAKFSVLTVTKERASIISFDDLLALGELR